MTDKINHTSRKDVQPEVVIPKIGRPIVTAHPASDIATCGSTVTGKAEIGKRKEKQTAIGRLIQQMDTWVDTRTVEVDMIESFLKRGYEWPLPNIPKPTKKKQRRQLQIWIEENRPRIDKKREEEYSSRNWWEVVKGGYKPTEQQGKEWNQLQMSLKENMLNHEEKDRIEIRIRGLTQELITGEGCTMVKEFIPKDHWVYVKLKEWLIREKPETDRRSEEKKDGISTICGKDTSLSSRDDSTENIMEDSKEVVDKKQPSPEKIVEASRDRNGGMKRQSAPCRATKEEISPARATEIHSSPERVTENQPSIFGVTNSPTAIETRRVVTVNAVNCGDQPADQRKPVHPTEFCRSLHWPHTLEDDLMTGQYACQDDTSPIIQYIDWTTFFKRTKKDDWKRAVTQEIMENRAMALDDWQLDSWAKAIDSKFGCIQEDEETDEWILSDRQNARVTDHIRSAVRWFRRQSMSTRLDRLSIDAWLAQEVRMYIRGRTKWPWQMGPPPTNDVEYRLLELWDMSIKREAPLLTTATEDYETWWKQVDRTAYKAEEIAEGDQLLIDASTLARNLWNIPPASPEEGLMYRHVTKGTTWPISNELMPPYSNLQRQIVTNWWAEKRESLAHRWGSCYTINVLREATRQWKGDTRATQQQRVAHASPGRRNAQQQRRRAIEFNTARSGTCRTQ